MDRATWIASKRQTSRERMNHEWAPIYDEHWGEISPSHQQFLTRFLHACPPGSLVLDVACGTGKYWPMVLAGGHKLLGIDQSEGMLGRAREKFPDVPVAQVGMQEMDYDEAFDGAMCVDAMESVSPEDWLPVLGNFYRAIRPQGYLYFSVETISEREIAEAFEAGLRLGVPIVYGEYAPEGSYHYYPGLDRVREWAAQAGFRVIDEMAGDEYQHFLVQKPAAPA